MYVLMDRNMSCQ